jgi:ferredoxin
MTRMLSRAALQQAIDGWLADGKGVTGPTQMRPGRVQYSPLASGGQLVTDGYVRPVNSIKPLVFPRHEPLFQFVGRGRQVRLQPVVPPATEQIVVAARPCDAAALPILDHVFLGQHADPPYGRRRAKLRVITLACLEHDSHCFCTSVGLGPDDPRGSDAMLVPLDGDQFEVRLLTDQGDQLLRAFTVAATRTGQPPPGPARHLPLQSIQQFLDTGFENPVWNDAAMRCHGCGACAHQCPTCHCFDVVDETSGGQGARVRNWDSCQQAIYSAHASGHNPRPAARQRQRNRIYHKYSHYPRKHGELLCTGCGACGRGCPVGLGVAGILDELAQQVPVSGQQQQRQREVIS